MRRERIAAGRGSMGEFPLPRIRDFLRTVVPFDTLDADELSRLVSLMEIAYFPRDQAILMAGDRPSDNLFIIMSGSVKVAVPDESGQEILVDVRGEGETFGSVSLLQGELALFTVTAREDVLAFMLPGPAFKALVDTNDIFQRHFSFSLARNIRAVRDAADSHLPLMTGTESLGLDAVLMNNRVGELMSKEVLTCLPASTVRAAAKLMTQRKVGAIIIADHHGLPLGILTDTDLRVRVLASGEDPEVPVAAVMSQPMKTISPKAFAFEAMIEMARHGTHHLAVTDGERLVGVISDHDLTVVTGSSPVGVIKEVAMVSTVEELALLPQRMNRVMEMLLRLGGSAEYMQEVITEFDDRLTLRLLRVTLRDMEQQGLGGPPVPYSWMALGGAGRRERVLPSPQDHAVAYAKVPAGVEGEVRGWFRDFVRRVGEGLAVCGFPVSSNGVMHSVEGCCRSEEQWEEAYLGWVTGDLNQDLSQVGVFFDMRLIYSETDFGDLLWEAASEVLRENRSFPRRLHAAGPDIRPPMGFVHEFVVAKDGEYLDSFNLRDSGITPVVNAARVMAMDKLVRRTNTLERLAIVTRQGLLKERFTADVHEAFSFISLLRIARYLERQGEADRSYDLVGADSLNSVQKKMLKESFQVINQLQDFMEKRYREAA